MWVFGYGSLIWNPGFEYLDSKVGFIRGYNRRFYQGNDFHRGNPEKLGRVATLVEDEQGLTWGKAFLLGPAAKSSISYLDSRETKLGGYCTTVTEFQPRNQKEDAFPTLLYIALPTSKMYMGPAPLRQIANDISEATGHCGHNAEYLLRLIHFMKEQVPDAWDEHLYHLEPLVKARLKEMNLSVEDVMGEEKPLAIACVMVESSDDVLNVRERSPSPSSDFASRVLSRKLKCLDI